MTDTKRCSKCGEVKGLGEFGKRTALKDGLDTRCKQCNREAANAYRRANLDAVREKDRIRAAAMPADERRAKHKRWRDANRDYVREKGRETMRRLYRLDPEKFRAAIRERKRKDVAELVDNYVKRVIFPDGIPEDIPTELIALKREQLAIKRMARELKKATQGEPK